MAKMRLVDRDLLGIMYGVKFEGDLRQQSLHDLVKYQFGEMGLVRSILMESNDEQKFKDILEKIKPEDVIEIGTAKGISSLLMSLYADSIRTFDTLDYPEKYVLWNIHDAVKKIQFYQCESNDDKRRELNFMDFDFAFVDGDHSFAGVAFDFGCVKKCGRVLFHDYYLKDTKHPLAKEYPKHSGSSVETIAWDVTNFVDSLPKEEVTINEPFALWEKR